MRSVGRSSKEKGDIERAKENLDELMVKFEDLEIEFNEALARNVKKSTWKSWNLMISKSPRERATFPSRNLPFAGFPGTSVPAALPSPSTKLGIVKNYLF